MAKKHPRSYPMEFRQSVIDLARAGQRPDEFAVKFEPSEQTVRKWIKQSELHGGKRSDGLTSAERDELVKLRKEAQPLRMALRYETRWPRLRLALRRVVQ